MTERQDVFHRVVFWLVYSVLIAGCMTGCGGSMSNAGPLLLDPDGDFRLLTPDERSQLPAGDGGVVTVLVTESLSPSKPIAGAEVDIIGSGGVQHEQVSDENGICRFEESFSGDVAVSVDHATYPPNRGVTTIPRGGRYIVVLLDGTSKVEGKVVSAVSGEPVTRYRLRFLGDTSWFSPNWRGKFVEFESADGTFEAVGIRDAWGIVVRADGYAPQELPLSRGLRTERRYFEFSLSPAYIVSGRIADAAGNPIAGAQVLPTTEDYDGYHSRVETDADGKFVIDDLAEPPVGILAVHDEYAPELVSVPEGQPGEGIVISVTMNSGIEVTGTVRLDGQPVSNADVVLTSRALDFRRSATTGAEGTYRFDHVPLGSYLVRANLEPAEVRAIPHDAPERIAIRDGSRGEVGIVDEDFGFVQSKALVEGFIRFGEDPAMATVSIAYRDGDQYMLTTEADDGGWYQLTGMPEGHYVVAVDAAIPETVTQSRNPDGDIVLRYDTMRRYFRVTVPADGYVQQDFDLRSGAVIRGVVRGVPEGARSVDVRLSFLWPDEGTAILLRPEMLHVEDDGTFIAGGLPPGRYQVDAEVDARPGNRERGRLRDGDEGLSLPAANATLTDHGEHRGESAVATPVEVLIENDAEFDVELSVAAVSAVTH